MNWGQQKQTCLRTQRTGGGLVVEGKLQNLYKLQRLSFSEGPADGGFGCLLGCDFDLKPFLPPLPPPAKSIYNIPNSGRSLHTCRVLRAQPGPLHT